MKIFLSYKRTDLDAARAFRETLRLQRPDWRIYFDLDQLRAGAFGTEHLDRALQEAEAFVFLIGETIGDWQRMEYASAIQRRVREPSLPICVVMLPAGRRDGLAFMETITQIEMGETGSPEALARMLGGIEERPQQQPELWRLVSPYPGLSALGVENASFLYGRDQDLDRLLDRLAQEGNPGILTILGDSGVGKSSFVKAGLFAALLRESRRHGETGADWPAALKGSRRWLMASLRPGFSPVRELARTIVGWTRDGSSSADFQNEVEQWLAHLMQPGATLQQPLAAAREACRKLKGIWPERILLHVDQAEELYALASPEEARRFSEILSDSRWVAGLQILLTMRSDYCPELQKDRPLLEASDLIDLPPLDAAGLEALIRQPAEALGAAWEDPQLPDRLRAMALSDLKSGAPLLSHALFKLWSEMQAGGDGVLRGDPASDLSDFLIAGVKRAQDSRPLRRLFALRLTLAVKDGQGQVRFLRRRALQEEMTPEEWRLAQELAGPRFRLLHVGWETETEEPQGFAEAAHESFLQTSWFRDWVRADEPFMLWLTEVDRAARDWRAAGRDPEALLVGRALPEAEQWMRSHRADLTRDHLEFLMASFAEEHAVVRDAPKRYGPQFFPNFFTELFALIARHAFFRSRQTPVQTRERDAPIEPPALKPVVLDAQEKIDIPRYFQDPASASMPICLIHPVAKGDAPGFREDGGAWGIKAMGAEASPWDGEGVTIAVLDSGVDARHKAFKGVELIRKDFTGEGNADEDGHGTHCAGIIFGRDVRGRRIGVARGVRRALIGKVLSLRRPAQSGWLLDAMEWARQEGAHIISMSVAFDHNKQTQILLALKWQPDLAADMVLKASIKNLKAFEAAVNYAKARSAENGAPLVVAATGNASRRDLGRHYRISAFLPAAADGVLSVGALEREGAHFRAADFSNTMGKLSAPGVGILSAKAGGGLIAMSGTSMACPHVAGAAALWWQKLRQQGCKPDAEIVKACLLASARRRDVFTEGTDQDDTGMGLVTAPLD